MKKYKIYLSLCNILMAIPFIYLILFFILDSYGLTFTNLSFYTFFTIHVILTIIIMVWTPTNDTKSSESMEILMTCKCAVGLVLFNILLIFVIFCISSFLYEPEHFIHINGKTIVARGANNSSSSISYYDTKTIFIRCQESTSINVK